MVYKVRCDKCGANYTAKLDFAPSFCARCGNPVVGMTKSRATAEEKMTELDEIRPRLEAAWDAYFALRVEYEDRLQFLAQYQKRGVITQDEINRYRIKTSGYKQELNKALKAYRENRRAEHGLGTG